MSSISSQSAQSPATEGTEGISLYAMATPADHHLRSAETTAATPSEMNSAISPRVAGAVDPISEMISSNAAVPTSTSVVCRKNHNQCFHLPRRTVLLLKIWLSLTPLATAVLTFWLARHLLQSSSAALSLGAVIIATTITTVTALRNVVGCWKTLDGISTTAEPNLQSIKAQA